MTTTPDALTELRKTIAQYGPIVDTTADQYAHNIVGIALAMIAQDHGNAAANAAIDDYDLEAKGWRKH